MGACARSTPTRDDGMRIALGVRYNGQAYQGWQSQRSGLTVQDRLEAALARFADAPISTLCAGRTDAGVHALMQVVHFDTDIERARSRGCVAPTAICRPTSRSSRRIRCPMPSTAAPARLARRYRYELSQSPVRPSLDAGRVGWSMRRLDGDAMRAAAALLIGTHDFSSFRASACQARSPVKQLRRIDIARLDVRPMANAAAGSSSSRPMPSCTT